MEICFEVITNAELSKLQSEASEVPFLVDGVPLVMRMARGRVLGVEFGDFNDAPQPPTRLMLAVTVSPFRLKVYKALVEVKRGETLTYSQLADRAGCPKSTRAVASAVASNPFAYIVPCHRIVPAHQPPGNYRWGAPLKARLLTMEKY